ncbi:MAG TPA: dihydrofolate reductase, partial [Dongiaceae bacterium]
MSGPRAGSCIDIVLVAAVADNGVIGRSGALPWRLKSDMRRFRAMTWG